MADFDLIGRVQLVVDQKALKEISSRLDNAFSKKFTKSLSLETLLDTKQLNKLGQFARAYEAFQERIRRSNRLTESQKKKFLGRGQSLFTSFSQNPAEFEQGFRSELQLLKQAAARQQDINTRLKKIAALRKQAQDILDPSARAGVTRSLNILKKKARTDDFGNLDKIDTRLQSVAGRIQGRLSAQAGVQKSAQQAADAQRRLFDQERQIRTAASRKARNERKLEDQREINDSIAENNEREKKVKERIESRQKEAAALLRQDKQLRTTASRSELQKGKKQDQREVDDSIAKHNAQEKELREKIESRQRQAVQLSAADKQIRTAASRKARNEQKAEDQQEIADSIAKHNQNEREAKEKILAKQKSAADLLLADKQARTAANRKERERTRKQRQDDEKAFEQDLIRRAIAQEKAEKNRNTSINRANRLERTRRNTVRGHSAEGFGDQSALAFKRFAAFSIAAGGLFTIVEVLRQGVTEAISFEQQLVKLAQVGNTSVSALGAFRAEIDSLSVGFGVSSANLVESAVTIRQAGFSLAETKAALETLALTTLSPSFNDLKNTTEGLIALKSQFGTSADEFKRQFGEINAVSKAFAVESEDIVTVIRKSGGAFKVAGGNVRELIALFTAVRSTTRESADTIATGFRTIFARLQRPQVIDELKGFGIELRNVEGDFVGPLKAVEEINKALGDVGGGDIQFARIAEQIGGIRQISKVIPLIQQFALAQRAANIELLGANSLAEDAEIAQTSLANKMTKTKETFLKFARELTLGEQFKTLASGLLTAANAMTKFAESVAPLLPALAGAFAISNIGTASRFAAGFSNRIAGGKGKFFGQRGFANATAGVLPFIGRQGRLRLGASLPAAGIVGGFGVSALGGQLANTNPITNRRQFLAGRSLEGAGGGISAGILAGGALGSVIPGIGTAVGAALGGVAGGLYTFKEALQEAEDALEEQAFGPSIERLNSTLSLVGSGKISALGQRENLTSGLNALRERGVTATGVERDQLRGDIRQTVESLLIFNEKLIVSSKTLAEFNNQGGDEAIRFIAENSQLAADELRKQAESAISVRSKEEAISRKLFTAQEKLIVQANLVGAFGAALSDATSKANDMSQRFDFVATNLLGAGAVGVQFRGVAGFQDIFNRPGQISDLGLLGGAANQASGFLGPQFGGLGQQTVAISDILRQLPSILSEFAVNRPSGDIAESIDVFVRERLNKLAKNIPQGGISLEPIIDSIASSITSEISQQGKGQTEAIQKILDAPATFVNQIVGGSGFEQIFELFSQASSRFTERFNAYSNEFAQLTSRELQLREESVNNLDIFFDRAAQVEKVRNPRNFPIEVLRQQKLEQQTALLGGNAGLANNTNGILGRLGDVRSQILEKEQALQRSSEVTETQALIEQIITLQGEAASLGSAFQIAADRSDEIANKFHEIERIQLERDQRRQGADDFIFGDRASRNQLNLVTAATQFAAIDPDAFFNPNLIADSLRPAIGEFLDRFSELPVLNGLTGRQIKQNILERGVQRGVLNPQFLADLNPDKLNEAQEKLIEDIKKFSKEEREARNKLIGQERTNIFILITGINSSLKAFISDLRETLLEQLQQTTKNRLDAVSAQKGASQKQLDLFGVVTGAGGSGFNTQNQSVLRIFDQLKRVEDINRAINTLDNQGGFTGAHSRFQQRSRSVAPGFPNAARVLSISDARDIGFQTIRDLGPKLGVNNTEPFTNQFEEKLAEFRDRFGTNDLSPSTVIEAFNPAIDALIKAAREQNEERRKGPEGQRDGLGQSERDFLVKLGQLPPDQLAKVREAINALGDVRLDQVTEAFKTLDGEAKSLSTSLQDLTDKLRGLNPNKAGAPAAANPAGAAANPANNPIVQRNLDAAARGEAPNQLRANIAAEIERRKRTNESTRAFANEDTKTASGRINDILGDGLRVNNLDRSSSFIENLAKEAIEIRRDAASGGKSPEHQRAAAQSAADVFKNTNRLGPFQSQILDVLIRQTVPTLERVIKDADRIQENNRISRGAEQDIKNLNKQGENLKNIPSADLDALQKILSGFNTGISTFSSISPQMIKSMDAFPRSIEMAGTHKVEVTINGAQVLANIQPGLEQLVITEVEKAINKFASNNLPGIGSFS